MTDVEYRYVRRTNIRNAIGNVFAILIIAIVVLTIVFGIIFYEDPMTQYNNGIHADCGGSWDYDGFVVSKNRSRYSYHCDRCGRSLVLDEWRK